MISKLGGEATITMDTDWFYRRPSRLANNLFVVSISNLFTAAENLATRLTRILIRLSANPAGYLIRAKELAGHAFFGTAEPTREPLNFDPGRYRIPLWAMVLVVLLFFVVLMIWGLSTS